MHTVPAGVNILTSDRMNKIFYRLMYILFETFFINVKIELPKVAELGGTFCTQPLLAPKISILAV
jgi:hypothetical protein